MNVREIEEAVSESIIEIIRHWALRHQVEVAINGDSAIHFPSRGGDPRLVMMYPAAGGLEL